VRTVHFTKALAFAFLGVLVLSMIIILLALSPLGVNTLVNIANNQDGVTIENPSGSFYSQVRLGKVRFNNPQIQVIADVVNLDLGLKCLFAVEACIDNLSARRLDVVLIEDTIPNPPPEALTQYIELPIAAYLNRLSLDRLSVYTQKIDQQKVLLAEVGSVNASVSMHKALRVNELTVNDAVVILPSQLDAREQTKKAESAQSNTRAVHWINLLNTVQYTPVVLPNVFVPINVELKKVALAKFCVKQLIAKDLCTTNTQISGNIQQQKLVVTIATSPQAQVVSNINLHATLDLADDFSHSVNVLLKANQKLSSKNAESIAISLVGKVNGTELSVSSPKASDEILALSAQFDITKTSLPLNIALSANNYQQTLAAWLPQINLPVAGVKASINGTSQVYKLTASANIDSEQASDINLVGALSLTDKYFTLSQLQTSGDVGQLNASLYTKLTQFAGINGVSLTSEIGFKNLQVKPLIAQVDSQLNGSISVNANITAEQLWGEVNCKKVQGLLQGLSISLQCDVAINKAGLVHIKSFALEQGKNRVAGNGKFELPWAVNNGDLNAASQENLRWLEDGKADLQLHVNVVDLAGLYPEVSGIIVGSASIKGQTDKPKIVASAAINDVKFDSFTVDQAQIDVSIDLAKDWQSNIKLMATKIGQEKLLAEQVNITLEGDLSAHTLSLNLQHPQYSLSHDISGQAIVNKDDWRWLGKWEKGVFAFAFDSFTLEKPTSININSKSANIRSHCWLSLNDSSRLSKQLFAAPLTPVSSANGSSSESNRALCVEQMQYSESLSKVSANIAYNLKMPFLYYFPDIIEQGTSLPFSTDIELSYTPEKGIELDTYSLMTQANITTSKHNIELLAAVANISLQDQLVKTIVFAGTAATGAVGLNSTLNLDPINRTHRGQLRIDNVLLSPLQRFMPTIEKLTGALVGNILFDGPLVEPKLRGELQISDVELVLDNYPYPITNFNQTVTIANKQADIEGEFELGAGTADYTGTLTLFDEGKAFSFVGELKGSGMQLAFDENELLASPSLKIALDPSNFSLQGEITIPNAQIKIDELPKSAKSPTSDTIIIGKIPDPPLLPIGLDIDVRILLDPPKLKRVTINALDLKASLGGDVSVQVKQARDPITKVFSPLETYVYGEVNILTGSYEAYGQNLQVQKGAIFFSGAPSLPQFDITAVRNPLNTADNVVAGIRISGNPTVPKVELFSQPSMIQARQLSYLLQGTDLSGGESQSQNVMLVNLLVGFGVGNTENGVNRLGKSLGFDSLNVQTAGQGDSTQVQLTGRISDNIQVSYGVGLFDQASEVILRYQLFPQMYLEAKSGATSAVDIFYEWTRGEQP
jgi:translocation and assembly module TamB